MAANPQKSLRVEIFRYGLDARRSELVSSPGTLAVCENAHINAGGEVEKRKAFVRNQKGFSSNTFGLQDTDTGLMTFGSVDASLVTVPVGVVYTQLPHPTGFDKNGTASMTAVVYSCNFKGKAFVLAKFSDGKTFAYYVNGTTYLVGSGRNGWVLYGAAGVAETVHQLAEDLKSQVETLADWTAIANEDSVGGSSDSTGYHTTPQDGSVLMMSPPGIHFTPETLETTVGDGIITAILLDQNYGGTGGVGAYTHFTILSGTGFNVKSQWHEVGTEQVSITGGVVPFNTNFNTTALDIANAINRYTSATGYTAYASGSTATVTVYAPAAWGDSMNNVALALEVTNPTTPPDTSGSPGVNFNLTLTPPNITVVKTGVGASGLVSGTCAASTAGGSPGAISFVWHECDANGIDITTGLSGIAISSTTEPNVTFSKNMKDSDLDVTGYWNCQAEDINNHFTQKLVIRVNLSYVQLGGA